MTLRLTARSIPVLAVAAWAAACGSSHVSPALAKGCNRVAAPSGSDRAAGTAAAPFRSAQRLADALRPGQTGCLRGGDYPASSRSGYVVRFNHGRVRLRSWPGERAVLRGVVSVPRGSDGVRIANLSIDDPTAYAQDGQLTVQVNATGTVLDGLDVTNGHRKTCVQLGTGHGWGTAVRTVIRDSVIHDCGDPANGMRDHAIYAEHARSVRIEHNLIRDASGWGVHLYPDSDRALVRRNLIVGNGGGVIFAGEGVSASSGNRVLGNVIAFSTRGANLDAYWSGRIGRGNVARGNCLASRTGSNFGTRRGYASTANVTAVPRFLSGGPGGYRIAPDSPCAGAGPRG